MNAKADEFAAAELRGKGKTFQAALFQLLRCPFCGGALQASILTDRIENGYGVLSCYCGRYPVLEGIPVLKRGAIGSHGETTEQLVSLIEAGRYREALVALAVSVPTSPALAPAWMRSLSFLKSGRLVSHLVHNRISLGWREQAARFLDTPADQKTAWELFDFWFLKCGPGRKDARDYFAFRFGQPRHLVALSLASLIGEPARPILDLACGFGHVTHNLLQQTGNRPVIGIDRNFFALYTAKTCIAPEGAYACCDAEFGLPFPDGAFSAILCADAFHYFVEKRALTRQLVSLVAPDGLILFPVLHHAQDKSLGKSVALPLAGYLDLFHDIPCSLVSDTDILTRYLRKVGPRLELSGDVEQLVQEPTISLVASRNRNVFLDHGPFVSWPHGVGRLQINPLYVPGKGSGSGRVSLKRQFPGERYETENSACKRYLPEALEVDASTLQNLESGKRTPEVESLVERFVCFSMPDRYLNHNQQSVGLLIHQS